MLFGVAALVAAAAPSTLWTELRDTELVFVAQADTSAADVDRFVTLQVLKGQAEASFARPRDRSEPGFLEGAHYVFFLRAGEQVAGQRIPRSTFESSFHYGPFSEDDLREVVPVMTRALALQRKNKGREPDEWLLEVLATKTLASTAARAWKSLGREPPAAAREAAARRLLSPQADDLGGPALAQLLWLAGPVDKARVDERVLTVFEAGVGARPFGFYYRDAFAALRERLTTEDTIASRALLARLDALIAKVLR